MVKIIYIAGYGRSGSTVLATILGGHESVVSVGELINISRACTDEREYCACGSLGRDCNFWLQVRKKWLELAGISDLNEWVKISANYEGNSAIPSLILTPKRLLRSEKFKKYASGLAGLFEAISIVSGKQYIVDASKSPARALALAMIPGMEISFIHLIRDPRGVSWSLKKGLQADPKAGIQKPIKSIPVLSSILKWIITNKIVEIATARLSLSRAMILKYEDVVGDPSGSLKRVGQMVGLDFTEVIDRLSAGGGFPPGHTLAGNRVRMNNTIRLSADISWLDSYSRNDKLLYLLIAGWYAARYGYKVIPKKSATTNSRLSGALKPRRNIMLAVSSLGNGGAERAATILCNAWAERGDTVTLLATFSGRGECFYPLSDKVQLIYLSDLVGRHKESVPSKWARLLAIRRLIKEKKPDLVLSFLTNVNLAIIIATRGLGVPVIACERTNPNMHRLPYMMNLQRRWLYRQAEIITVQTESLATSLGPNWCNVRRLEVISNPLSPSLLSSPAPNIQKDNPRRRLLAMGRLATEKQFGMLIQLFSGLCGEFPEWDLWVIGEGPLRPELEQQIVSLGLAERVYLPGRTPTPWNELSQADAFVLPSSYEGFPNVLLEAMALGLPCISFDCPNGPREITRGGQDALLVPTGDTAGMTAALQRVMSDATLRQELGARARASVCERYALEAVLRQWDRLFDEASK